MAERDSKFYHYEGLCEFGAQCRARNVNNHCSDRWAGGTLEDALAYCEKGDLSHVPDAERLVERLDDDIDSNGTRPAWVPSVVGFVPVVPAYLAGAPEAMLARTEVPDARGEIEVWANTTVSAQCEAGDMMRRGVVTLAFAMALSRVRNVRLVLYSTTDSSNVAIKLACPLDFSEVCAAFCQPAITRRLIYGHALLDGFTGGWACWAEVKKGRVAERAALAKYAGMPADALHLSTEKLGEYASVDDAELVKVLNEKVHEYMEKR